MSSFGCAVRLVFIVCSVLAVFFGGVVLVLLVARSSGLLAAVPGGGAAVAAGTGVVGAVATAVTVAVRRGRDG